MLLTTLWRMEQVTSEHRLLERLNVIDNAVEDGAGHF